MTVKVDPNLQMLVDIVKTGSCIDSIVTKAIKPFKITHVQYNILRILRGVHPQPLYVGEVKNRLLFTNADITRLLDRMIQKGIIERQTCPENRRKIEVRIADKGLQLLLDATPKIEKALGYFLKDTISEQVAIEMSVQLATIRTKLA